MKCPVQAQQMKLGKEGLDVGKDDLPCSEAQLHMPARCMCLLPDKSLIVDWNVHHHAQSSLLG